MNTSLNLEECAYQAIQFEQFEVDDSRILQFSIKRRI